MMLHDWDILGIYKKNKLCVSKQLLTRMLISCEGLNCNSDLKIDYLTSFEILVFVYFLCVYCTALC